jgi:uncharacterized lipoprotein YmbA
VRIFAFLVSVLALVGSSCTRSPEPVLYALAPRAAAGMPSVPCRVALRRPGLSRYLDRLPIVRRATSDRLDLDGLEQWAAPLESMVTSTLVEDLSQRLPSCTIFAEEGSISVRADVSVELELQRFELSEQGLVELFAQVALLFPDTDGATLVERHALTKRPASRDAQAIVAALSDLLGELSDRIAKDIVGHPRPTALDAGTR